MNKHRGYNYIDLAKTIGMRHYKVRKEDHSELLKKIESHPLTKGILSVGQYFVLIGNVQSWKTIFLSKDCELLTGYSRKEAFEMGPELMVRFTHPEDFPIVMTYNEKGIKYLYSLSVEDRIFQTAIHYYRGVKKDGTVLNVQHQSFAIGFDVEGKPYIFANIYTDISHLNRPQIPKTFILDRRDNVLTEISVDKVLVEGNVLKITPREKEVLGLLASGLSSKAISEKLEISFHTVVTYRKRLLEKTGVKNTSELVNFALLHSLL